MISRYFPALRMQLPRQKRSSAAPLQGPQRPDRCGQAVFGTTAGWPAAVRFWRTYLCPFTRSIQLSISPHSRKAKAGFHPKKGTINALWLGDSGSVVVVPNSGTLSAGIETMKKPVKQLRLCLGVRVACTGAGDCDRARRATAQALTVPPPGHRAGLRFPPEQRVRF